MSLAHFDREGQRFFNSGREVVQTLAGLARAVETRDPAGIEKHYSPRYQGTPLGITTLQKVGDRDGIAVLRFAASGSSLDRTGALAEWQKYLAGFDSIEEVGLHLHRLEEWSGDDLAGIVRFEVIGTPRGAPRPGIDRGFFRMRFERTSEGLRIVESALVDGERQASPRDLFVNVAHAAGIDFVNRYYPAFLTQPLRFGMIRHGPGGITVADVDQDGFQDLFIPDGVESRAFRNRRDGTFEDVTAAWGLSGLDGVSVGTFADYDNDGWKDFFVSGTFRPNRLFHNDGPDASGAPHFRDVTAESGIGEDCCTTVASWADYDNDGDLDLFVGRYLDPRKYIPTTFYARNGEPDQLYRNEGNGHFANVTEEAGVGDPGLCLGSVFGDYDDDGDADLYVVNDFGRSTLFRNEGDGTFTDVTVETGTLAYGAGMSASFGDYDNDGRLDIYTADIRSEHAWFAEKPTVMRYMANSWRQGVWKSDMPLYFQIFRQSGFGFVQVFQEMAMGNHLLRNRGPNASGQANFEDVSWKTNANPVGWFWGSVLADLDNDGWKDIYSANGWVYNHPDTEIELDFLNNVVGSQDQYKTGIFFDPRHFGVQSWHGWERNRHLLNNGDGTFREIGRAAGTDLLANSRGVAVADFWNRGALDLAVAASAERHALLRNEVGPGRRWLQVELVGTKSNRDAVGARVTIQAGGKVQTQEVVLGDSYASQSALRLHFGLGTADKVDEMTVRWPSSGIVQKFRDVAAGRIVQVTEGEELVEKRYEVPDR
ncbi:MAG TPA: CRTAC1 family protein [Thermoanaerobaculia bacterium]|nr:CRTAC1 family protein [Thermoanaerobaculia bacterium]